MIAIGNKHIPATFIRNIELDGKSIVVKFFLGHKVILNFKSIKKAETEFRRVVTKFEKTKHTKNLMSS